MDANNTKNNEVDLFFKNLQHNAYDRKLSNVEFWCNEDQITAYCHSILNYAGYNQYNVKVQLVGTGAFRSSVLGSNQIISLPSIIQTDNDDDLFKQMQIRSVLLRHELAHILYSNQKKKIDILSTEELNSVYAIIEDARIENLFAQTFKGSRSGFENLSKLFFDNSLAVSIPTEKFNARNAYQYFQSKLYGIDLPKNDITSKYEALYQKYHYLLNETDHDKVYNGYKLFHNEVIKIEKQNAPEQKPEEKEMPEEIDTENIYDDQGSEEESNDESENVQEESNDESENVQEESNDDESEEESDEDAEGSELELEVPSNSDVDESDEELKESEEEFETPNTREDFLNNILCSIVNNGSAIDISDKKVNNMIYKSAYEINLMQLFEIMKVKKSTRRSYAVDPLNHVGYHSYNQIILKNKKVITQTVKFLSLKLQNRNRTKNLSFQEEGNLDQDNLKELFITSDEPRVFCRNISKITTGSQIIMLIDISGSMLAHQIKMCIINAIILVEVCKKLNIKYEISFFTNQPDYKIELKKNVSTKKIKKMFHNRLNDISVCQERRYGMKIELANANDNEQYNYLVFDMGNDSCIYILKDVGTPHKKIFECILGNIYSAGNVININGYTPEFSAMASIYKRYRNMKNNVVFIFNDGQYDIEDQFFDYNDQKSDIPEFKYSYISFKQTIPGAQNTMMRRIDEAISIFQSAITDKSFDEILKNIAIQSHTASFYVKNEVSIRKAYYDHLNDRIETLNKIKEDIQNPDAISNKINNSVNCTTSIDNDYFTANISSRSILVNGDDISYMIDSVIKAIVEHNCFSYTDYIYKKFIDNMRNEGFRVYGFGINSEVGVKYIGNDNFRVVTDVKDINENFSTKLMEIF